MVFQSFNLWPHLTLLGNVIEIPVHVLGRSKAEAIESADALLHRVGLYDKREVYPAFLSGGQQQRAAIARALAIQPEVMLFDEPTSALDPISTTAIEKLVIELKERVTIIIVTHNMQQAARVSDYTAFMYLGKLVELGKTDELFISPKEKLTEEYITGKFG